MRILLLSLLTLGACHVASPYEDDVYVPYDMQKTDASATCPADLTTAAGTFCAVEGMTCGSCSDPCQFCHLLVCQAGKWTDVESFPGECDGGTTD